MYLDTRTRTFGELMAELRARLSFVATGAASKGNEPVLRSFLQEAHDYVFGELEPPERRKRTSIAVIPGSFQYDWHNDAEDEDIEPGLATALWIGLGGQMHQIAQRLPGSTCTEDVPPHTGTPTHYEHLNGQIALWPVPDQPCQLIIDYTAGKPRFDRDADRPGVPDRLVFLYALANAKAHYRHPDAQAAATTFQNMLSKEKGRQKGRQRYFASALAEEALPTVRSVNGQYFFGG